jgi:hypothetical protein
MGACEKTGLETVSRKRHHIMTCVSLPYGEIVCDFAEYRNYICLEHTTYLMEFSRQFGPSWFTVPGDQEIDAIPGGSMGFLWEIFDEWIRGHNGKFR